jgi:antitoxin component YwqK of YwqJK toxin-antitoxin module
MALINCSECNKEISDTSEKCIGCGFPIKVSKPEYAKSNNIKWSKKRVSILILLILIISGIVFYAARTSYDSRDPYSLENIKVNEIEQLFSDYQATLKNTKTDKEKSDVYNLFPELHELFKYTLDGAFENEEKWIEFNSQPPYPIPYKVFRYIKHPKKTHLKDLYALFMQYEMITSELSYEEFSLANNELQVKFYYLGKSKGLLITTDILTFQTAWKEKNDTNSLLEAIDNYRHYYLDKELLSYYNFFVDNGMDLGSKTDFIRKIKDDQEREVLLYLISDSDNNTELKKICDLLNISFSSIPLDDINTIKDITNKKAFDSNGNLMGLLSESGLWTGHWKEYYSNNVLAIEGNYKGGLMNGKFKCYLRDGTLCHEGSFKNGIRNERNSYGYVTSGRIGLHNFYHSNGKIMCRKNVTSENFKNCNVQYWHSNGVKGGEVKFSSFYKERDREIEWIDDYGRWQSRYTYKNSLVYFDYSVTYWNTNGLQESIVTKWRQKRSDMDEELIEKGFLKY